jgi:transcriptional regulator with XRE-family HTH domain
MKEILKRIRENRKLRGYSLENMAAELNISDSSYRKIENNQIKLSLERFLQITAILDVSITDLIGEKFHRESHRDSNEMTLKLIDSLDSNIKHQQDEISFLRDQLSDK